VVKHLSEHIVVMYLGQLVERATPEELFANPKHPYTRALLSAIPIPDPDIRMSRVKLRGELSSPINMGSGCRFVKRCPYASEECNEPIKQIEVSPDHFVSCHKVNSTELE
jgi:peptide/nickel transport system ATP-binding protein